MGGKSGGDIDSTRASPFTTPCIPTAWFLGCLPARPATGGASRAGASNNARNAGPGPIRASNR